MLAEGIGVVRLDVTQGREGERLAVGLVDAVVDHADAADELHRALVDAYGRSFEVDCGTAGPVVAKPGSTFGCKATDENGARTITATVENSAGDLSFDLGGT